MSIGLQNVLSTPALAGIRREFAVAVSRTKTGPKCPILPICVCVCVCTDKEKMKGFYLRVWAIFEQFKSELIQERSTNIMQLFKTSP